MYIRHVMSHDLMSYHFFILPMFCLALVLFSYCYLYSSISPVTLAHTFLGCLELVYFFFAVHSRTTSRGRSVTHGVYCILIRVLHEDANGRFLFSAVFVFVRTVLKQRIQEFPVCVKLVFTRGLQIKQNTAKQRRTLISKAYHGTR